MTIGIIILAAGASQRMGRPKQTLALNAEKSMLQFTVETALATKLRPVIVVVGANKAEVVPELAGYPVTIVDNAFWQEGMASSIRVGLAGLYMTEPKLDGVLMLVCDQPYLTTALLEQMVATFQELGKKAVACRYKKTVGGTRADRTRTSGRIDRDQRRSRCQTDAAKTQIGGSFRGF